MTREPVLIGNAVVALVALGFAIAHGALTEGIVLAAALAVVSVIVRQRVTPTP